jgi:predicted dehydrogenase
VRQGRLGALLGGRGVYYGGWMHNGIHLVDTLCLLFGPGIEVTAAAPATTGRPGDADLRVTLKADRAEFFLESFDEAYYQLFEVEIRFAQGRLRFLDFGSQIHVEAVEVNEIGERELKPWQDSPWSGLESPLFEAMAAIEAQLHGAKIFQELGVDLNSAAKTMNLLWRARDLAAVLKG